MEPIVEVIYRELGVQEMVLTDPLTLRRLQAERIARAVQATTPSPDLKADNAALVERYRHKKRGTVYEKIGVAELQCATGQNPGEGEGLVIYRGEDGKLWARMADEFHDGRFEALQATEPRP